MPIILSVLMIAWNAVVIGWLWILVAYGMGERRHDVFTPLALVLMGFLLAHVIMGFLMAIQILMAYKIMMVVSVLAIAGCAWEEGKFGGLCWFPMANIPLLAMAILVLKKSKWCCKPQPHKP